MSTDIARLRSQLAFLIPETTPGVIAYPTVTDLKILALDLIQMDQEHPKTSSPEITGDTRDTIALCNGISPAGSWSLQTLSRPAGAGIVPQEANLMTAAFGKSSIIASTKVDYELDIIKQTYTLWRKSGHTVYFATGTTCNNYSESLGSECELRLNFDGNFMQMGWAGTSAVTGVSGTVITATNTDRFTIGAKVELVDDVGNVEDNSGSGFIVVSKTSTTITVSPTVPVATYVSVNGFIPEGLETGSPLPARPATVTVGSYTAKIRDLSLTFTDNVSYIEDEITGLGYPVSFAEGQRDVSGSMTMYFREDDTDFHEWAKLNTGKVLSVDMGGAAGSNRETTLLDVRFSKVTVSNDDPSLGIQVEFMAKGTVSEDSISITYN